MENSKLKRRLWLTTMLVFMTYTSILFIKPSIYLSLLPIIIPTGVVTIAIPSQNIYNNIKEKNQKIKQEIAIEHNEYNITKTNEFNTIKNNTEKEKILSNQEKNITHEIFYETKEKPKVKTKGTIHH